MDDLTNQTALVVGGSGALGRQQALGLARAGANIALADIAEDRLAEIHREIETLGRKVSSSAVDITDPSAVERLVDSIVAEFGGIDILVNSAGITRRSPSEEFDEALFDRIIAVNLNGLFFVTQAVGRQMIAKGGGRIINMGSIFGAVGLPESPAYSMSKGAVCQMTRTLAVEWAPHGIAVNAILPSWFETPMGNVVTDRNLFYKGAGKIPTSAELTERTIGRVPLARLGQPPEIIAATVFLASAPMVTGHLLAVDGGFLAQ